MRLEHLVLRNWCKSAYKELDFSPGMNAMLGPNGSGKSTTLNAIVFALTGDYSRSAGTKTENIYQLAPTGPASVRLVFTHNNMRFDVTRGLRDVTTTLIVTGLDGSPIENVRAENKVTKRLNELLHVNSEILSGYVFVGQGKMFEPFDTTITPAARMVAFQQLFGLDRLEALWEAIGEQLVGLPVIVAPDTAPYIVELGVIQREAHQAQQMFGALADMAGWRLEQDPDYLLISRARELAGLSGTLTQRRLTRQSALHTWWLNRKELRETQQQHSVMVAGLASLDGSKTQVDAILRASQTLIQVEQEHNRLKIERDAAAALLEAQIARAPSPVVAGSQTAEQLRERVTAVDTELAIDRELLIRMGDGTVCPTCGQSIGEANLADRAMTQQRVTNNMSTVDALRSLLSARLTIDLAWQRHEVEVERLQTRCTLINRQFQDSLTRLTALSRVSDADVTWAQQQQQTVATIQRGIDQMAGKLGPLHAADVNQRTLIRQARSVIRDLASQVAQAPSMDRVGQAERNLNVKSVRSRDYATAQANHNNQQQRLQQATEQLARMDELGRMAAQGQVLRTKLQTLRDILHRDNLPKALLQQRLLAIGHATNEALELFGAPFRLEPREDKLSYRAIFFDGVDQPIERLSGGQKVIMALAFRIAVNARFASELGLLCLDEPTVYLDADNVRCLEPALVRLRQHAQATGLQCVLITHEDVGNLFDHVITCP